MATADADIVTEAQAADAVATVFRSRIVESADVDPRVLISNDLNWRTHSRTATDATRSSVTRLGWVKRVIVQHGTNLILDGHMRVVVAIEQAQPTVPVDYVDLDDDEAAEALRTLDAMVEMGHDVDVSKLRELQDRFSARLGAARDSAEAELMSLMTRHYAAHAKVTVAELMRDGTTRRVSFDAKIDDGDGDQLSDEFVSFNMSMTPDDRAVVLRAVTLAKSLYHVPTTPAALVAIAADFVKAHAG